MIFGKCFDTIIFSMNQTTEPKNDGYAKRPLWQWVVVYAVIGGIIYAGIYYFFLAKKGGYNETVSTTPTQTAETTQQAPATITYSSSGFSPSTVTVKSGGTITWINTSDKEVQIGANPHPAHSGNREVSGGEFTLNLQPGEEKSVVVSKVGTFGFHNVG